MTDTINHPAHYTTGNIEVIDFIEDKNLSYCRGNIIKYVVRAGIKDPLTEVEDLKKARWYIDREIKRMEGEVHKWQQILDLFKGGAFKVW